MFNEGEADLSGITGGKDLFVSDAVHKAMLEVQRDRNRERRKNNLCGIKGSSNIYNIDELQ